MGYPTDQDFEEARRDRRPPASRAHAFHKPETVGLDPRSCTECGKAEEHPIHRTAIAERDEMLRTITQAHRVGFHFGTGPCVCKFCHEARKRGLVSSPEDDEAVQTVEALTRQLHEMQQSNVRLQNASAHGYRIENDHIMPMDGDACLFCWPPEHVPAALEVMQRGIAELCRQYGWNEDESALAFIKRKFEEGLA